MLHQVKIRSLCLALFVGVVVCLCRLPSRPQGTGDHTAGTIQPISGGALNDMGLPACYAWQLLRGADPYGPVCQWRGVPGWPVLANPLTAGVFFLPFMAVFQNDRVAAAVVLGCSYGLLT